MPSIDPTQRSVKVLFETTNDQNIGKALDENTSNDLTPYIIISICVSIIICLIWVILATCWYFKMKLKAMGKLNEFEMTTCESPNSPKFEKVKSGSEHSGMPDIGSTNFINLQSTESEMKMQQNRESDSSEGNEMYIVTEEMKTPQTETGKDDDSLSDFEAEQLYIKGNGAIPTRTPSTLIGGADV